MLINQVLLSLYPVFVSFQNQFELGIRRGNHGPLNKTTRSIYVFSIDYRDLTIENLHNHIQKKVEEAISDADKSSADYRYFDIHKVRILSSLKKPIKDNPFLDSFTNESLRTVCCSDYPA